MIFIKLLAVIAVVRLGVTSMHSFLFVSCYSVMNTYYFCNWGSIGEACYAKETLAKAKKECPCEPNSC